MIKNINGYDVEIEADNGEGVSQCFVIKGKYSASLACLEATGELSWGDLVVRVPESIVDKISTFAEANGY